METPSLRPATVEEHPDRGIETAVSKTGFSLARLVIVLYIAGLVAAMMATSSSENTDPAAAVPASANQSNSL